MNNYYSILGLEKSASITQVKKAYRSLAHKYHPDKHKGDNYFESIFKEINEAYEVLSNPKLKNDYDNRHNDFISQKRKGTERSENNKSEVNRIYDQIQDIAKLFLIHGKDGIDSYKAFKALNSLFTEEIIVFLLDFGNPKSNKVIIRDVLGCFKYLPFPYSEYLSIKLSKLAGSDNELIKEIYNTIKVEKYRGYISKHGWLIVPIVFLIIVLLVELDACN